MKHITKFKSPRLLRQRIRKRYYKTLGASVKTAQCPLSPCLSNPYAPQLSEELVQGTNVIFSFSCDELTSSPKNKNKFVDLHN